MPSDDRATHEQLVARLRDSIARLRETVEARSDPILEEIAYALEVIAEMITHTHEHAVSNRERIETLEDTDR